MGAWKSASSFICMEKNEEECCWRALPSLSDTVAVLTGPRIRSILTGSAFAKKRTVIRFEVNF